MRLVVGDRSLPSALGALDAMRRDGGEGGVGLLIMFDEIAREATDKVAKGTPMGAVRVAVNEVRAKGVRRRGV